MKNPVEILTYKKIKRGKLFRHIWIIATLAFIGYNSIVINSILLTIAAIISIGFDIMVIKALDFQKEIRDKAKEDFEKHMGKAFTNEEFDEVKINLNGDKSQD